MTTESPLELRASKAVRRFTPPLYQEDRPQGLSVRDSVSARLVSISNELQSGNDTEDTRRLIDIFLALDPGATPDDASAKKALFAELRVAASFIPMGLYDYSIPFEEAERPSQFLKVNDMVRADTARGGEGVWSTAKGFSYHFNTSSYSWRRCFRIRSLQVRLPGIQRLAKL